MPSRWMNKEDGDRIMVDDSLYDAALDAFDEYDIEYEEV